MMNQISKQTLSKKDQDYLSKYINKSPNLIADLRKGMSRDLACKKYKGIVGRNPILDLKNIVLIELGYERDDDSENFNEKELALYYIISIKALNNYHTINNADELW